MLKFIKFLWFYLGGRVQAKCGHSTKRTDQVSAFGQTATTTITPKPGEAPDYCHRCLEKMAICCAWCGKVIFVADPITLYTPRYNSYQPKEHYVKYRDNPLQYVGCLRMNCAQTGSDRAGFWMSPGQVLRILSPIEQSFMQRSPVIVQDLHDMREATPLAEIE